MCAGDTVPPEDPIDLDFAIVFLSPVCPFYELHTTDASSKRANMLASTPVRISVVLCESSLLLALDFGPVCAKN